MEEIFKPSLFDVESNGEVFHLEGFPCSLSAFSHVPVTRNVSKDRTYFNAPTKPNSHGFIFDTVYAKETDFNPKLHRCDRKHHRLMGLHTHDEEKTKTVPSLSSSEYGHRLGNMTDSRDRQHARIMLVESEFYRRNGLDFGK